MAITGLESNMNPQTQFMEFQARMTLVREETLAAFVLFVAIVFLISRFFKSRKASRRIYIGAFLILLIVIAAYFYVLNSLAGLR
jgi:bacteriorhodopsin